MAAETKDTKTTFKPVVGPEHVQAMMDEWAKFEQKGLEQARQAIDELSRMAHASLQYATQLSSEWRRLSMEGARRASEAVAQGPWGPRA